MQLSKMTLTVLSLLRQSKSEIAAQLSNIYEHSAWVAEEFVQKHESSFQTVETVSNLASAMKSIVDASSMEKKLALLRSHPDLCEKVGALEQLTKSSQEEQSRAGLQSLTNEELEEFTKLNQRYRETFNFPFILAVRNVTKYTVLSALRGRVNNSQDVEIAICLQQVHKIAWMRLLAMLDTADAKGFLTCHVLDTANGCPGTSPLIIVRSPMKFFSLIFYLVKF